MQPCIYTGCSSATTLGLGQHGPIRTSSHAASHLWIGSHLPASVTQPVLFSGVPSLGPSALSCHLRSLSVSPFLRETGWLAHGPDSSAVSWPGLPLHADTLQSSSCQSVMHGPSLPARRAGPATRGSRPSTSVVLGQPRAGAAPNTSVVRGQPCALDGMYTSPILANVLTRGPSCPLYTIVDVVSSVS